MDALGITVQQLLTQLISFLILFFLLYKLAYGPIMGMLDSRSQKIKESLEAAETARLEAASSAEKVEAEIASAHHGAKFRSDSCFKVITKSSESSTICVHLCDSKLNCLRKPDDKRYVFSPWSSSSFLPSTLKQRFNLSTFPNVKRADRLVRPFPTIGSGTGSPTFCPRPKRSPACRFLSSACALSCS